jgi:two-component system phosphate regulon sensor histidine kinase PhoR
MYQYNLNNRGFNLEKKLASDNIIINADKNAITEALLNLLDNAVKYSGDSKSISVKTYAENKYGIIEVTDTGIGISSEQQKKIFDKFYRVSTGLTHNTKGSGLGLSIVQHIMHAHEGVVRVVSQPSKGSTFQLKFPLL